MSAQKNEASSRRDDLESLGYILVYFMLGKLPWQDVKVDKAKKKKKEKKKEKEKISQIMISTSITSLCENLPEEFELYLNYCRGLKFQEKPDYDYLRSLFQRLAKDSCIPCDDVFEWEGQNEMPVKNSQNSDSILEKAIHNSNGNTPNLPHDITVRILAYLTL